MIPKEHRMFQCGMRGSVQSLLVFAAILTIPSAANWAQSENASDRFLAADVHPASTGINHAARSFLKGDRYIVHDSTMADMIASAYGMKPADVIGGPGWLEWDRFDLTAKIPPGTTPEAIRPMMQRLLWERFQLLVHQDSKPVPAFVLKVGKDKLKMKPGDAAAPGGCKGGSQNAGDGSAASMQYDCVNQTMEMIVANLGSMARQYVPGPVVDQTGLKGAWNFSLKWTPKGQLALAGGEGITFSDAVQNGLGLRLEQATVPMPVLLVESVNETPTPNAANIGNVLPPLAPAELEVSMIRPSKPDTQMSGKASEDQLQLSGFTLDQLIRWAWSLPDNGPLLSGGPDWVRKDKWDIVAEAARKQGDPALDEEDWDRILQKLLAERFKLVVHTGEMTADAYDLIAVNAKLKKADQGERTRCYQGVGPDNRDPRAGNPLLNKVRTCQGITMAQFASTLREIADVNTPVRDKTGLHEAYDFTIGFTGAGRLQSSTAKTAGNEAGDPGIAMSFADALDKEIGLTLQRVKRPLAVLQMDRAERPTED